MTTPVGVTPAVSPSHRSESASGAWVRWHHTLDEATLGSLVDHDRAPDLFHTLPWFQHLHHCGIDRGDALHVAHACDAAGGSGFLLPLLRRTGAPAAVLGSSITSLSNYYSSLYGPIGAAAAVTADSCRALARSLRRDINGSSVIDLQPLDPEGPLCRHLADALRAEGYAVDTYFCFGNWYLPVNGRRWADIEPSIPSKQRNTIKRARKKFAEEGAWTLTVHTEPGQALEQAIQDYEAIYARSWKQPEPFVDFVPGLCRWTAARGWLRLGVMRLGDTPIAAQIWFVHQGKALIFKLAYDESHKRLSAGSVLTAELMRHVVDVDAAEEIDYLTGDDAYKADWMTHRRERVGLVAFRLGSPHGLAAAARHALGRLRSARRQTRQAPPASVAAPGANA